MTRRAIVLAAIVFAGLTSNSVAGADEGWARHERERGWERRHAEPARTGPDNASFTAQQGSGNAASVVQTGSGDIAGIRQFGRDNTGAILQTGNNSTACLIQIGRNLDGGIQQVGDNQSNGVLQTRQGSIEIPVETCALTMGRADLMTYLPARAETSMRFRPRGFGRHEQ